MSNLITAQIEKKTDDYVARKEINNKKNSEQNTTSSGADSSSSSEYKKKTPQKGFKKRKFLDLSNSSSDGESDSESDWVCKNFLIEMITVDMKFLFGIL